MSVWRDGTSVGHTVVDARSHAERQPLEAVTWLGEQGLTLSQIETFVVIAGPGSFTGLRVGVAAVQGWAFATGRPVAAVPTLAALAQSLALADARDAVVVPCMDGLRGEVFWGAWADGVALLDAAVGAPADAVASVAAVAAGRPVVVAGDGADRHPDVWRAAGWRLVEPALTLAESAVRLVAAGHYAAASPHAVRPLYVRRTDAEIMRERRGQTS